MKNYSIKNLIVASALIIGLWVVFFGGTIESARFFLEIFGLIYLFQIVITAVKDKEKRENL